MAAGLTLNTTTRRTYSLTHLPHEIYADPSFWEKYLTNLH